MNDQEFTDEPILADEHFDASENISDNMIASSTDTSKSKRRQLEELLEERNLRKQLEGYDDLIDQYY